MDYSKFKVIQVIKKSDKAEVSFAAVDGLDMPVVVKKIYGANPDIYRAISEINNIHIPRIYFIEEREKELLVVEEYVGGKTLDVYMAENVLEELQKLDLMMQLCEALEVLHGCNPPVIHRDIKPTNILVNEEGVLKVIDFDASRQYKGDKNTSDTRLLGTIEYAAPEQFGYAQTDFRSDIYSAGVVFSELSMNEKIGFFKDWKRLVDKCTSFDPENRYKDTAELKRDLQKCIRQARQPGRKKWTVLIAVVLIFMIMLAGGGVQKLRERSQEVSVTMAQKNALDDEKGTQVPEETERADITEVPQTASDREEGSFVLAEDRIVRGNEELPVIAMVRKGVTCEISEVYVCELETETDPFSEMIVRVETELYEVSVDGRQLQLLPEFFKEYGTEDEVVLYIVFDDGRGERLWIMHEEM